MLGHPHRPIALTVVCLAIFERPSRCLVDGKGSRYTYALRHKIRMLFAQISQTGTNSTPRGLR